MNVRTTIILAILVALFGGYYFWSERQPKPDTGNPKLFTFDDKAVQEVTIARGGITLSLKRDGDAWRLTQPVDAKADQAPAAALVSGLTLTRTERTVEEKAANLTDFGLDPPAMHIALKVKDTTEPVTLLLGKNSPTGSWVYAKRGDSPAILMLPASLKGDLEKTPMDLRDKRLIAFEATEVKSIRLVWPDVTIVLEKEGDNWKLREPHTADAESGKVLDVLHTVSRLRFKDIATGKPGDLTRYGLAKPQVEVIVRKTDGTDLPAIELGKTDKDTNVLFARVKNSPTVYVLDPRSLDELPRDPAKLKKDVSKEKKP
jgi:hypothetical protein